MVRLQLSRFLSGSYEGACSDGLDGHAGTDGGGGGGRKSLRLSMKN